MKKNGIVRSIDNLGRIVIPKEMRDHLGIVCDDPIEIYTTGDKIVLSKFTPGCCFCGEETDNVFSGKKVCKNCIAEIKSNEK